MQNMPRLYYDFLAIADVACWCVCFWWMHRISSRQDAVLDQLRKQAERIENISKEQHAILAEVHPNVESIQKRSTKSRTMWPALREKWRNRPDFSWCHQVPLVHSGFGSA